MTNPSTYSLLRFAFTRHPFIFCFIHGLTIGGNIVLPITGEWHWLVGAMGIAVELIYWIGSFQHRKRLRGMKPSNPLNHDPLLWDASPYVCIHGVLPDSKTLRCSWPYKHSSDIEPTEKERGIRIPR